MSTTAAVPTAADLADTVVVLADDDISHIVQDCDGDQALCGVRVSDRPWVDTIDNPDDVWCPECLAIEHEGDTVHLAECEFCRLADAARP